MKLNVHNLSTQEKKKKKDPRVPVAAERRGGACHHRQEEEERKKAPLKLMLARSQRLQGRDEIKQILRKGGIVRRRYLSLRCLKNNLPFSRFGFVVSAKVSPKASARNLLKRRSREIIRKNLPSIEKGYDFLFIFSPPAAAIGFSELEQELSAVLWEKFSL